MVNASLRSIVLLECQFLEEIHRHFKGCSWAQANLQNQILTCSWIMIYIIQERKANECNQPVCCRHRMKNFRKCLNNLPQAKISLFSNKKQSKYLKITSRPLVKFKTQLWPSILKHLCMTHMLSRRKCSTFKPGMYSLHLGKRSNPPKLPQWELNLLLSRTGRIRKRCLLQKKVVELFERLLRYQLQRRQTVL